ncbi:MAG TPA: PorP/SprF family type IX secretion system membrane protein [Chitinophagaceae bacterium]|nr:PorP/SprF family type IX secretion system membrane protein [Chitinophagaceae bacterium]
MKKIIKHIILPFFFATIFISVDAQSYLNFSQYFNTPLFVNPANTGFDPTHDYRIGANYRNQWPSFGGQYQTMNIWGDVQLFNNKFENGWIGLGGTLLKDVAAGGSLTSTKGFVSIAYHQVLGNNSLLSAGLGIGMVNQRVDPSMLTFNDQWNGQIFDIKLPTSSPIIYSSIYHLDLQAGVNYAYFASDNVYLNAGFSVTHLNHPSESFYAVNNAANQIPFRYTAFLNSNIKIQNLWILNPNAYVSKMASAWEIVAGLNANRNLSGDGTNQLILGLYYRSNAALIPMIGYQLNDVKITFNYDTTVSTVSPNNQTAYELSIIKSGFLGGADKSLNATKCPKAISF